MSSATVDLQTALKARIPFVGVHTDDPVNVMAVLQSIAGKKLMALPIGKTQPIGDLYVWWTQDVSQITTERYKQLCETGASCVAINVEKHALVMDVGTLPTPDSFFVDYLKDFVAKETIPALVTVLKGLSLKAAQEVVQLTMARTQSVTPQEVRKTRQMISAQHPGLESLETDYDFYEWPHALGEWLHLNDKYFLDPNVPAKLVPRGVLLAGDPGTGKSMGAMVLAKHWDVPLFRLDVSLSLNRYLGESESRIARSLALIEAAAPCVWLLDEVEKLFSRGGDEGTTDRILSQLLWWLQMHTSRVLTVMTTNNLSLLPKEMYRPGRIDKVIHTQRLTMPQAKAFAVRAFEAVLKKTPTPGQKKMLWRELERYHAQREILLTHAEARTLTYDLIKEEDWLKGE